MPITQVRFGIDGDTAEARDVHVLRGQNTAPLRERVWVRDATTKDWDTLANYQAHHHDVEVSFAPVFKCKPDGTGKKLQGFGISIDKHTGKIDTKAAPAGHSPSNFIVEVSVEDNGDGIPAPLIPNGILRVHVHRSVKNVWLTPTKLTIRREQTAGHEEFTGARFTVRAQFDDDTVGDITDSGEVSFTPAAWFGFDNFVRIPESAGSAVAPFKVKAKTSTNWNGKQSEGTLEILRPWSKEQAVPTADLVDGAPQVFDGTLKPNRLPNVLFLGTGFTAADRNGFEEITNWVVKKLRTDTLLQPFGFLANAINYWRLMLPSSERGVSVRCEVQQFMQHGQLFASILWPPAEPPPAAIDWNLQHLTYMAGLPVPADLDLVADRDTQLPLPSVDFLRDRAPATLDFSALQRKWIETMRLDDPVGMVHTISPDVVHQWLSLCDRTFIDEVDVYPPVAIGSPPAASFLDTGKLQFHENRSRFFGERREALFKRVKATPRNGLTLTVEASGTQSSDLGSLWAELRDSSVFDNRDYVAMFSNMPFGRADSTIHTRLSLFAIPPDGELFVMENHIPVERDPARNALKLALPEPRVAIIDDDTAKVFAHEVGHTFGLGDEYAEGPTTYDGDEAGLASYGNLTTIQTVLDPATQKVNYDQIKWNWHRISKATTLTRPFGLRPGGLFLAFVKKGAGDRFAVGDIVRLRQRDPRNVLGKDPVISNVEFVVDSVHPENLDDSHDQLNMTVVLKNESVGANVDAFGPNSVMYVPIPASPPLFDPVLHPYLTLVSPAGQRMMDKIGGTLTGTACPLAAGGDNLDYATQTPVAEDPENKVAKADLPGVVGLYWGGRQFACGALHPTGHCMMRNEHGNAGNSFCPVCRYVLVDRVDPDQHELIDSEYGAIYRL